jgi:hypothetical protein
MAFGMFYFVFCSWSFCGSCWLDGSYVMIWHGFGFALLFPTCLPGIGCLFLGVVSLVCFALLVGLVSMEVSFSTCFLAVAC